MTSSAESHQTTAHHHVELRARAGTGAAGAFLAVTASGRRPLIHPPRRPKLPDAVRAACAAIGAVLYRSSPSTGVEPGRDPCADTGRNSGRAHVSIGAASPGFAMTLQGAELAIGRLHPDSSCGWPMRSGKHAAPECRSPACSRPIDRPHSASAASPTSSTRCTLTARRRHAWHRAARLPEAQLWHETAARNGVVCPYGPRDRADEITASRPA